MKVLIPLIVLFVAAVIVIPQALYTVDETQFVVVTRFGEIRSIEQTPGLHTKVPFVDVANVFDNRVLRIDVTPTSMPDVDNQFLTVDAYVRYRITNPQLFVENLRTQVNANGRIGDLVISALRGQIGRATQPDIIGGDLKGLNDEGLADVEPRLVDGIPTREAIVAAALEAANSNAAEEGNDFGVVFLLQPGQNDGCVQPARIRHHNLHDPCFLGLGALWRSQNYTVERILLPVP